MPEQPQIDWARVVEQIRAGDPAGQETLYRTLASGARLFLRRRLGSSAEVEDRVHDIFVIVVDAIRSGELRQPERLMGFVRTLLYRQLSAEMRRLMQERATEELVEAGAFEAAGPSPEQAAMEQQKIAIMKQLLDELNDRDFEILSRFYLQGEREEEVRRQMSLTLTQFNLLKSRAKARFARMVKRRLGKRQPNRR